jgi:hypothetical protein
MSDKDKDKDEKEEERDHEIKAAPPSDRDDVPRDKGRPTRGTTKKPEKPMAGGG